MPSQKHQPYASYLMAFVVLASIGLGFALGQRSVLRAQEAPGRASAVRPFSILSKVLVHIENNYVDPVDSETLAEGAVEGMVARLDPHSTYLSPDEFRVLEGDTQGAFGGVGIEVIWDDGWLIVQGTVPGGPAERAGILAGDKILAIDSHAARDARFSEALLWLRGEVGSRVTVRVRREHTESSLSFELERQIIESPAVESRLIGNVLYCRIRSFSERTASDLSRALDQLQSASGASGRVLLDLRGNPGGLLDQAVQVSDAFLDSGTIVSTRARSGEVVAEHNAHGPGTRPDWPIVVLIDHFSASAAEIVAAALQDHHRATLVGTRSWGKGSVQTVIPLGNGGALKLTIARYFTPSGRSIQGRGVEPDVVVPQATETGAYPSERSLERSLDGLGVTGPLGDRAAPRGSASDAEGDTFERDPQARAGLGVLRALAN